ncbi:tetratricopeptide repeat protein [Candidatus Binatia bacterium]|nr:tetratricopeptide repeat protein [Candidatus Binatia bacterium]
MNRPVVSFFRTGAAKGRGKDTGMRCFRRTPLPRTNAEVDAGVRGNPRSAAGGFLAALILLAGATAGPLHAQSGGDLRAQARQIGADVAAARSAGRLDTATQQRAVEQLGQLVVGFISASDRAANSGDAGRQAESLRPTFEAIHTPLDDIYKQNTEALERMARKVMDEDGDLEALYETQPFRDAQVIASAALYYLNWLSYYGARLYDGPRRKALLEQAQRGFSEFATGDRRSDLLVESLLGRGLCYLELGEAALARRDLEAVIADAKASPERRNKARLALLDAAVQAGNTAEALRMSDEILAAGARTDENVVRFLRLRALMAAARRGTGAEAERYRQQALVLMEQLRRAGAGWDERVSALLQTGVDNPEQWAAKATSPFAQWELARMLAQKNDYKAAAPLLEAVVASDDPQVRPNRREAQYMLGLAKFQAGEYVAAADLLDAALAEGTPAYGADAAYMRFKALEAEVAKQPTPEITERYGHAIRDLLARYPDHRSVFEAQFRLGELLQAQREFAAAVDAYAAVRGEPMLQLRARFATLQCQFELLGAAGDGTDPAAQRRVRLEAIGRDLESFAQEAAALEKSAGRTAAPAVQPMQAKVAIMRAVYAKLLPGDRGAEVLRALAGFETSYPEEKDLLPQVVRLRLEADQRLGRFAEAQSEVATHGAVLVGGLGRQGIEELAVGFIREGARRRAREGDGVNDAAQKVALGLYELLADGADGSGKTALTMARLYETTGDLKKATDLYNEVQQKGPSPAALRGLARIAEAEKRPAEAIERWRQFTALARPGDAPWYEGQYELARTTALSGDAKGACAQLDKLKPAMPGLSDVELRRKLGDLYDQTCR